MLKGHVGLHIRLLGLGHAREKRPFKLNIFISGLGPSLLRVWYETT